MMMHHADLSTRLDDGHLGVVLENQYVVNIADGHHKQYILEDTMTFNYMCVSFLDFQDERVFI